MEAEMMAVLSRTLATAGLLMLGVPGAPAVASTPRSIYSTIDLGKCRQTARHPDGSTWLCKGPQGLDIYVAEGDLRFFVSMGSAPHNRRAASQTLGPFNSIFKGDGDRATLEWRLKGGTRGKPYAAILRFHTDRGEGKASGKGQVLVVFRIDERETCQVGWIDALANPDGISIARRLADDVAPGFDCSKDPIVAGARGRSPM
jgi:hypothetical protein